ncbi:hypothetical protein [Peredibacter starrii]|uniref:STAS domain-containing protein n=1 Tax=Peredibacter starrii TaxID=28202 RepID=A0AAX4HTS3_9BACT|nr:hypothetical protein [Peredibacter starrii]WPU66626.1 hypothetical protein SOO65_07700 [Peredibacter starrii]
MDHSFEIVIKENIHSMFIGISGLIRKEDLHQFESTLLKIEAVKEISTFIFDLTLLEEAPLLVTSVLMLMQMEARKKGRVYCMPPLNHLKMELSKFGVIRDSETMPIEVPIFSPT